MTSLKTIREFISHKKLVVIGVSRNRKKFGNYIYKQLKNKGYDVYAIHPYMDTIEGDTVYSSLDRLPETVDGAVLNISPEKAEEAVKEAAQAGIKRIWFQQGSSNNEAFRICKENGIDFVCDQCIIMFAEPVESFHKFHKWIWKLIGKYPA
ncbi:MAG: CoA-binding protein [Melioribacteraceae bacterium]|nr:CoA-binding protein [Melioribacteraceae bacterium]